MHRERATLPRFAGLAIAAAVVTMALKGLAYWLTGSIGILSDALESLVNLAGAVMALAMLSIAARPPDDEHAYGHSKAEYFSSVVEGALILAAAGSIGVAAVARLLEPRAIEQTGAGLTVAAAAAILNAGVAAVLLRAGRRHHSIALEASGQHLFTDVWTTAGVLAGVGTVTLTGWQWLDPVIALAVAGNIVRTGVGLVNASISGLMDAAWPARDQAALRAVLDGFTEHGVAYHALRTRQSGPLRFVSLHVLVPGEWSVQRGHEMLERIDAAIRDAFANVAVFTHLEPIEDPVSWHDVELGRDTGATGAVGAAGAAGTDASGSGERSEHP